MGGYRYFHVAGCGSRSVWGLEDYWNFTVEELKIFDFPSVNAHCARGGT